MSVISAAIGALALAAGPGDVRAPDPCQLATAAEITAALGGKPTKGEVSGPDEENDYKAKSWTCIMAVGKIHLFISLIEFPSAALADKGYARQLQISKDDRETMQMGPATGVGEKSLWGADEDGAIWMGLKGRFMIGTTITGEAKSFAQYREPLRKLAVAALGRIGS